VDVTIQLAQLGNAKSLRETMQRMENAGVEGFLLPSPIAEFAARTFKDEPLRVPAVGIAAAVPFPGMTSIRVDERQATLELMAMLFEMGHTRIGHIIGPQRQSGSIVRYRGYREALTSRGIRPRPEWVVRSTFDFHTGERAALELLQRELRVTAVFAANDTLAAAVLAAAHRLSIPVPDALSVVGYDDSPIAEQVWPALTTVRQDAAAMTERAVEVLHDRTRAGGSGPPIKDVIFPYRVVTRSSIAPARETGV
jgi:LacI family transcriptional regulator